MTEEQEKQEVAVWKPTQPFEGTDLLPELRTQESLAPAPPGGLVGRENVEPSDLILPALQLLQGQSDAVTNGVEGAQPGKYYHTASGEVLVAPLRALIVHHSRSRALFPKGSDPRSQGLEKCLARDAMTGTTYGECDSCPHRQWGENNEKPPCAESHNFVVWSNKGPAVLRMSKTSFKNARNFLTTWNLAEKNLWAHAVLIDSRKHSKTLADGSATTYFTVEMRWDQREDVPPEFQAGAVKFYGQIQKAHEEGRFGSDDEHEDA